MINIILILILVTLVGGAALYVYKAKKRGQTCIGCPHSKTCGSNKCNCGSQDK